MSINNNKENYYQEEPDFLETLYINSEFLIKKICSIMITISLMLFLFILFFILPHIIQYEYKEYKGINQVKPLIFEVNGESYPDLNNLQEFENSGINLDAIPVEEE